MLKLSAFGIQYSEFVCLGWWLSLSALNASSMNFECVMP